MNFLWKIILSCVLQVTLISTLNIDETLSDDEEFEILQDLILELDLENRTETERITIPPGLKEDDHEEDSTEVWEYTSEEILVEELIDNEFGEELVEIIQQRDPTLSEQSNLILVVGISIPIILLLCVLIVLVALKLRGRAERGKPSSQTRSEQV